MGSGGGGGGNGGGDGVSKAVAIQDLRAMRETQAKRAVAEARVAQKM